ncbi:MAG: hypothetical protein IIC32_06655 [Chloroflexi bacterium]|nr:hypothetical protein [Chloroflexota bacterium]MCI0778496.1 hypothetical protein [Chloroflexota bacterium]
MREPPSLLRTGLAAAWSLGVAAVVWLRVSPLYEGWLVAAGNAVLPGDLRLERIGASIMVGSGDAYLHAIDTLVLHSGIVAVLAVVAATPARSWRWRATAVLAVVGGLFALQVAGVSAFALALRSAAGGGVAPGDAFIGFAIFWALTPLVVGGAWAHRFWLGSFRRVENAA